MTNKKLMERRYLPTIEVRVITDEVAEPKIVGYAAVFNSLSDDLGGWKEIIRPGAFSDVITNGADVRALVDHISDKIIGRTKSGTLTISEDEKGLYTEILPANTQAGRDIVESLKRGDVSGMSFQFVVGDFNWIKINDEPVREVKSFQELYDVSVVTFPAFPGTNADLRSNKEILKEYRDSQEKTENEKQDEKQIDIKEEEKENILEKEKRDRDIHIKSFYLK